jgi:hypothetical protein
MDGPVPDWEREAMEEELARQRELAARRAGQALDADGGDQPRTADKEDMPLWAGVLHMLRRIWNPAGRRLDENEMYYPSENAGLWQKLRPVIFIGVILIFMVLAMQTCALMIVRQRGGVDSQLSPEEQQRRMVEAAGLEDAPRADTGEDITPLNEATGQAVPIR